MAAFADFPALLEYLDRRGVFHVQLGLERMRTALSACGLAKPPFLMAQVLGTNGKGSTSVMLAEIAREHGILTGLYTSPHFLSPLERIHVDGREVERGAWLCAANELMDNAPNARDLSYFEFVTVLAVLLFRKLGVELAVLEAGLGGRNDATSALPASLEIFAPIDIDHAAVIGPGLEDIARDKAAAIRPASLVCSALQSPVVRRVLDESAARAGTGIVYCGPLAQSLEPGMAGAHQRGNAALAALAWNFLAKQLGMEACEEAVARGIANAAIPGRMQLVTGDPPILLDGAHNPHALRKVLPEVANILGPRINVVFSALGDKDWLQMGGMLAEKLPQAQFFIPGLANRRAGNPEEIAVEINSHLPGSAIPVENTRRALRLALADGRPVAALGSLYLLAEIYELYPQYLKLTGNAERRS